MESLPEQEDKDPPKAAIVNKPVKQPENPFKKPILFGKIGRLPKKLSPKEAESIDTSEINSTVSDKIGDTIKYEPNVQPNCLKDPPVAAQQLSENAVLLPYIEPDWSGLPESKSRDFIFEVLKNGAIIETINLMAKPFWLFGRLANCDVCMQHPTISRYHAVLQYRQKPSKTEGPGFYIYDLDSTHGTFLNKNRLKPKVFVRIQVGHLLKLGCSTRSYILNGPEYDEEEESELSVTELKQKRQDEILKRAEEKLKIEKELEEKKKKEEERGVDWGLGEDADEETDLSENPYAQTNNEELYLDDPKKALRGFFEREGLDLEYDCNEQGIGQFLCRVELPVDDEMGRPIVAEVLHKGKKKEAVIQCALEACRILDRYGMLRQATHESRKRKAKNWEENDFYDSDEDTFFDRTGTIEKKREKRMNTKATQKVETYESLNEKEKSISKQISELEAQLASYQTKGDGNGRETEEEDSLDTYMERLKDTKTDKKAISSLKMELAHLRIEHAKVIRLVNIAKPANLPALEKPHSSTNTDAKPKHLFNTLCFGKQKVTKFVFDRSKKDDVVPNDMDDEEEDAETVEEKVEEKMEEETKMEETKVTENQENTNADDDVRNQNVSEENLSTTSHERDDLSSSLSSSQLFANECLKILQDDSMSYEKLESIWGKNLVHAGKYKENIEKIVDTLKKLATNGDRMNLDFKILSAKMKKILKLMLDMEREDRDSNLEHRISSELKRLISEISSIKEQKCKDRETVKKVVNEVQNVTAAILKDLRVPQFEDEEMSSPVRLEDGIDVISAASESVNTNISPVDVLPENNSSNVVGSSSNNLDENKKKKKNQRRIHQKQEKVEQERQKGYVEDASRENYCMWVPPNDQSGDGKTNLNDKYGY